MMFQDGWKWDGGVTYEMEWNLVNNWIVRQSKVWSVTRSGIIVVVIMHVS